MAQHCGSGWHLCIAPVEHGWLGNSATLCRVWQLYPYCAPAEVWPLYKVATVGVTGHFPLRMTKHMRSLTSSTPARCGLLTLGSFEGRPMSSLMKIVSPRHWMDVPRSWIVLVVRNLTGGMSGWKAYKTVSLLRQTVLGVRSVSAWLTSSRRRESTRTTIKRSNFFGDSLRKFLTSVERGAHLLDEGF